MGFGLLSRRWWRALDWYRPLFRICNWSNSWKAKHPSADGVLEEVYADDVGDNADVGNYDFGWRLAVGPPSRFHLVLR